MKKSGRGQLRLALLLGTLLVAAFGQAAAGPAAHLRQAPVVTAMIGQIGGATYGLDASGELAVVGVGSRLVIVQTAGSPAPEGSGRPAGWQRYVGQSDLLPGVVQDVKVHGNLAYVALGEAGVQVIDLSDPTMPALRGRLDLTGNARRLALASDRLYVADSAGALQIVSVADVDQPLWLGAYPGQARNVAAVGNTVYLLRGVHMLLLDVSDPANPTLLGDYASDSYLETAVIVGATAFLTAGTGGLEVVDVTNPAAPVRIGQYVTPGVAKGIVVQNGIAYVTVMQDGLHLLDVQNPAALQQLGLYAYANIGDAVQVSQGRALIAGKDKNLVILDVTQPEEPTWQGVFDGPGSPTRLRLQGAHAFVTDAEDGLWILDISDPAHIAPLSVFDTPDIPQNVTVGDGLAYVADGDSGLQILDVSDASQPALVGSYDTAGYAFDVAISNTLAYVADGPRLSVIDVSQPATPTLTALLTLRDARSVDVAGNLMYVTDFRSPRGLRTFSLSNPAAPVLLSTYPYDGTAGEVRVDDQKAYIAQTVGLEIASVVSPTAPLGLASLMLPGYSFSLAVAAPHVFVASGSAGLQIVDASEPTQPHVVGVAAIPGSVQGVALQDDLAVTAAYAGGVVVVRTTPLTIARFFPRM